MYLVVPAAATWEFYVFSDKVAFWPFNSYFSLNFEIYASYGSWKKMNT